MKKLKSILLFPQKIIPILERICEKAMQLNPNCIGISGNLIVSGDEKFALPLEVNFSQFVLSIYLEFPKIENFNLLSERPFKKRIN